MPTPAAANEQLATPPGGRDSCVARQRRRSRLPGRACCLGLVILCGCGGGRRLAVEGTVTLDGQPLATGTIHLRPLAETRGPDVAGTIEAGRFAIPAGEGPLPGKYRVEIHSPLELPRELTDPLHYDRFERYRPPPDPLPEIYHARSTLAVEVRGDAANRFEFELFTLPPADAAARSTRKEQP